MKNYIFAPMLMIATLFLGGCGIINRDKVVESEDVSPVVVGSTEDADNSQEQGRPDFFERADGIIVSSDEVADSSEQTQEDTELRRIDKTEEIVNAITNEAPQPESVEPPRVSPATGPAIPEDEMRTILNDQLISQGLKPRY
jgi:methyl coenzyme M reductase subunit C-like uncharacterized protein (methanogenesis marker protein 7)